MLTLSRASVHFTAPPKATKSASRSLTVPLNSGLQTGTLQMHISIQKFSSASGSNAQGRETKSS